MLYTEARKMGTWLGDQAVINNRMCVSDSLDF